MSYEITGKLIYKEDIQQINDRFQKREFVIEVENERNSQWNNFIKIQLIQDRCELIENIQLQENIKVYFDLRGRKWENQGQTAYFTNLEGWRIERMQPQQEQPSHAVQIPEYRVEDIPQQQEQDDLPF
ncbi:MAG: DUF3127 domain-containing protein [Odoribacteraceae bacterium]|jgi:hypothetical protein|nr:DUF3127 domain-containing protein [Odoribacteraceae bacterium]